MTLEHDKTLAKGGVAMIVVANVLVDESAVRYTAHVNAGGKKTEGRYQYSALPPACGRFDRVPNFDEFVKSHHSGENRSDDKLEPINITGFRPSPE